METLILICLLIVIGLLAWDKIAAAPSNSLEGNRPTEKSKEEIDDILGAPKPRKIHAKLFDLGKGIAPNSLSDGNNFPQFAGFNDLEVFHQEELAEDLAYAPDFDEEEEEWRNGGEFYRENGFATGVTFDELSCVGMILQHEELKIPLEQKTVQIFYKLDGTELLNLLESSIDNAAQKIAILLDSTTPGKTNFGAPPIGNYENINFDISDYS